MGRRKLGQKKNTPKSCKSISLNQNNDGGCSPNTKINNKCHVQLKEEQHLSDRIFDAAKVDEDDGIHSSAEENSYEDTDVLKLQDIANIVIGDLKQVRVNESTFSITDESNITKCYNTSEISKIHYDNPKNHDEDKRDSVFEVEKYTDEHTIHDDDSDTEEVIVEVVNVSQCSLPDLNCSKSEEESEVSNTEIIVNNDCNEINKSSGNSPRISEKTFSNDNLSFLKPTAVVTARNETSDTETNDAANGYDIEIISDINRSEEEVDVNDGPSNSTKIVSERTLAENIPTNHEEIDEDFDLSIDADKDDAQSLNENNSCQDTSRSDDSMGASKEFIEQFNITLDSWEDGQKENDVMIFDEQDNSSPRNDVETEILHDVAPVENICSYDSIQADSVKKIQIIVDDNSKFGLPENDRTPEINHLNAEILQDLNGFEIKTEKSKSPVNENLNIRDQKYFNSKQIVENLNNVTDVNKYVNLKKTTKEISKPRKISEKGKKSEKKESMNKQRKKSTECNKSKEEKRETKKSDRRRRSDRLKSKPDYNEKYEEEQLLEKLKNEEKLNSKNENGNDVTQSRASANNCVKDCENLVSVSSESNDMPPFQVIWENEYHTERSFSKDAERMICDCILTKEEILRGESGCGEDCLNRLLLIECCSRCTLGERCTNKRFQKRKYAKSEAYKTKKKGYGLRVLEDIPSGTFIMEYVGEVINSDEFEERAMKYARGKIPHFYFMSLKSDCIIDATVKGNYSRFINHSCEPNAETQKWTVQGELRIGFFSKRDISAGEEITFDYQLQRYGKQAQRCYCEMPSCTGWIGEDPDKQVDDDKRKERKKKKRDEYHDWETALDEICQVGLINRHQTLSLNRLMVHAKELPVRMQILQLIEEGHPACRRLFLDYHGLPIICSWMVDCAPNQDELKIQLLKTLMALPITNKTILVDSKVYSIVEQWAFVVDQKLQSEALSAQSVLESVEDIASADETPVSEMAQKVLNLWSSLREAYRIPKKERIQQMKEHEREADQNVVKPRPRRLPLYAEKIRDRYHRNRYNRDKDFEKIYFDRMKDYDKHDKNKRKRESPDRGRNFENRDHHRKIEFKDSTNKVSRMEHRYMFEMKVAREKEEKRREEEFLKRKWEGDEQQQAFWIQQNQNLYYAGQQHQMIPGQYITSVPPPTYAPDGSMIPSNMLQNIQPLTSTRTHSHNYYTPQSSYISPNIVLTHIPPPTPTSISQQSTPSMLLPSQVNASPQTYYQNSLTLTSYPTCSTPALPVPYPHQTLTDLTSTNTSKRTEINGESTSFSLDYQRLLNHQQATPVEEIPIPNDEQTSVYSDSQSYDYKENTSSVTNAAELIAANYTSKEFTDALASSAAAAIDINQLNLPPKWKATRDSEGRIYYYHKKTRLSQWYPPTWEEPPPNEEVEQSDLDDASDEDSSVDDEEEIVETKKRRRKYDNIDIITKRNYREKVEKESDQNSYDMDAEIKENLAAMSSEFQDTDNEDYSPVLKDIEDEGCNLMESDPSINANTPPSTIPLITEHIISPREPIDERERIRKKRRIKSLKEKLRRQKRQQRMMNSLNENSGISGCNSNGVYVNSSITSSSVTSKLLSVPADTSCVTDRKRKDVFLSSMANFVVNCLNPYFRSTCTTARITNYNDFKHLARKLTHFVMLKELKHCRNATDLTCNSSVKHKAKEYIRKYMSKFGEIYVRPPDDANY